MMRDCGFDASGYYSMDGKVPVNIMSLSVSVRVVVRVVVSL